MPVKSPFRQLQGVLTLWYVAVSDNRTHLELMGAINRFVVGPAALVFCLATPQLSGDLLERCRDVR
jgi:hypothetical protein